jgi:branched-chain amino acid transport system ATP-binding protein/branched-chain amino acid transport system permease protein
VDYIAQILIFICIYAILAGSFNLLVGLSGLFSIAHGAFFGIGAYVVALLTAPTAGVLASPLNVWLAMPLAVVAAALFGMVIAAPALRVHSDYLVVLSFGFQMVVVGVFLNWTGVTGGEGGVTGIPRPDFFALDLITPAYFLVYAAAVTALCYLLLWRMTSTPFGRMLRAIREDEVAAEALGKHVVRSKVLVFALASALAGVGGVLFAQYVRVVDPASFTIDTSVEVLAMLILGGTGNMVGSALGAAILIALPEALRFLDIGAGNAEQIRQIVFGALLILMLRFRSQGLLPEYWTPAWLRRLRERRIRETAGADVAGQLPAAILGRSGGAGADGPLMVVENVSKSFGGIQALKDFSMELPVGRISGLIGPNGAGKTTAFNLITGFLAPDSGRIWLRGRDITQARPHELAALGVSRSFQNLRLFSKMTVLDNVLVARPRQSGERLWRNLLLPLATDRETERNRQVALDVLGFVGLRAHAMELAENLSYAEEKLLALARMLAMEAELLLLDEPASGLDPQSVEKLFGIIRDLAERGKTVCIIEHNLDVIKDLTHRVVYLDEGRAFAEGTPAAVMNNPELAERYFGV